MRILLLPLDERPCNYQFPQGMCEDAADVQLVLPPKEILGNKKQPGNVDAISAWLLSAGSTCEYAVISLDMLVFGGLVYSRLHHFSFDMCIPKLEILKELRQKNPCIRIYGFSLIMRSPAYDSSEEEPDYYAKYGHALFEFGYYSDKKTIEKLLPQEEHLESQARDFIPRDILDEFHKRRVVNHRINEAAIALVAEGVLDFLTIPLDDCAQYGWAAIEQRALREKVIMTHLSDKVYFYSGADEAGDILVARAVNNVRNVVPAVYVQYSSVHGPYIVPKYEDRPLGENIKWLLAVTNSHLCAIPDAADFILMVNAPPVSAEKMGEAPSLSHLLDRSYGTDRCLPEFVGSLAEYVKQHHVVLADVAVANGADRELMEQLENLGLLGDLYSYAGWNTAANALGCCLAHAMIRTKEPKKDSSFLLLRYLEDWGYMADIRHQVKERAETNGGNYFCIEGQEEALSSFASTALTEYLVRLSPQSVRPGIISVTFPWHRLFEIGLSFVPVVDKEKCMAEER